MIGLLVVALLGATGDSRLELTTRGKIDVRVAMRSDATGSCTLTVADNTAQWRTMAGTNETVAGPSAYVPARAGGDRTRIDVLAAGFSVIAVLHDAQSGKLLAKVAGGCDRKEGPTVVTPPTSSSRTTSIYVPTKQSLVKRARLTGTVDGQVAQARSRNRDPL